MLLLNLKWQISVKKVLILGLCTSIVDAIWLNMYSIYETFKAQWNPCFIIVSMFDLSSQCNYFDTAGNFKLSITVFMISYVKIIYFWKFVLCVLERMVAKLDFESYNQPSHLMFVILVKGITIAIGIDLFIVNFSVVSLTYLPVIQKVVWALYVLFSFYGITINHLILIIGCY